MRWISRFMRSRPAPPPPEPVKPLKRYDPPEDPPPMPEENTLKPNWDRDGNFIGWST